MANGTKGTRATKKAFGRLASIGRWLIVTLPPAVVVALNVFDSLVRLSTQHNPGAQAGIVVAGGLLLAGGIILLCKGPLERPLDRFRRRGRRLIGKYPVVFQRFAFVVAVAMIAAGSYLLLPRSTKHLLRSWLAGPQIDLAASRLVGAPPSAREDQFVANLPWFCYGCDFGREDWASGVSRRRNDVEVQLRAAREKGIKGVAWFLLADGRGAPRFDASGMPLPLEPTFWADYDAALDIARRLDLGILWVLLDQQWFFPSRMEVGQDGRRITFAGRAAVLNDKNRRDTFIKEVLVPLVSRYPYERQILGWVLVNEPDNVIRKGYLTTEALASFVGDATAAIREHSNGQRVSIAFNDLESLVGAGIEGPPILRSLDFWVFHHYRDYLPPPADHVRALIQDSSNLNATPMYVGEFDARRGPGEDGAFEFSRWIATLGYQGAWPWSVNTLTRVAQEGVQTAAVDPAASGIGLPAITSAMRAVAAPELLPGFARRQELLTSVAGGRGLEPWATWVHDGQTIMRTLGGYDPANARQSTAELGKEALVLTEVVRQKELELATPGGAVYQCFVESESNVKNRESDLNRESEAMYQQTRYRDVTLGQIRDLLVKKKTGPELAALREQEKQQDWWVNSYLQKARVAFREVERAAAALQSCRRFKAQSERTKRDAETRLSEIGEQIAELKRERWGALTYVEFWRSELDWATRVGLVPRP